jgi:hypothetical protein
MNKPVNVLTISLHKSISSYNIETGEVGRNIQSYVLFNEQRIIPDLIHDTIKNKVKEILDKNYIELSQIVENGSIFEESRLAFQSFEDENGHTEDEQTPYFVDNDLYIEINQGSVSINELKEIFPEISLY